MLPEIALLILGGQVEFAADYTEAFEGAAIQFAPEFVGIVAERWPVPFWQGYMKVTFFDSPIYENTNASSVGSCGVGHQPFDRPFGGSTCFSMPARSSDGEVSFAPFHTAHVRSVQPA